MQALPLVSLASRSSFGGRVSYFRVVDWSDTSRFISINDITRQQIRECSALGELSALDATKYLAEYMGMPGLVKGVAWGSGMLVFSENLKYYTRVCESRVTGNKIKFNYGSEEFKEDRANCWEFCAKRQRIEVIKTVKRDNAIEYPFVLSRPDETRCPVCLDDLEGNVVECTSKHQICLRCFNLLPLLSGVKKCLLCTKPAYTREEYDKVDKMNGSLTEKSTVFSMTLSAPNSFKEYIYNEALFLGMLKYHSNTYDMDNFRTMLISSLYNFYMGHNDAFSCYDFNLTYYKENNNRSYNPIKDDVGQVIKSYIDTIYDTLHSPGYVAIYTDIAYTNYHLRGYDDIEFFRDLERVEGNIERLKDYPNGNKDILKREIYFRNKIANTTATEMKAYFINIFERILNRAKGQTQYFQYSEVEEV
jgi:hypothetical protein